MHLIHWKIGHRQCLGCMQYYIAFQVGRCVTDAFCWVKCPIVLILIIHCLLAVLATQNTPVLQPEDFLCWALPSWVCAVVITGAVRCRCRCTVIMVATLEQWSYCKDLPIWTWSCTALMIKESKPFRPFFILRAGL